MTEKISFKHNSFFSRFKNRSLFFSLYFFTSWSYCIFTCLLVRDKQDANYQTTFLWKLFVCVCVCVSIWVGSVISFCQFGLVESSVYKNNSMQLQVTGSIIFMRVPPRQPYTIIFFFVIDNLNEPSVRMSLLWQFSWTAKVHQLNQWPVVKTSLIRLKNNHQNLLCSFFSTFLNSSSSPQGNMRNKSNYLI